MKLSLRNKILLFAVIPILAIFLCYVGIKDINGGKNAIDIADLTVEDIKKGTYVKGNIPYLLDSFAYEETTEKHAFSEKKETTKYYYIMPLVNTDEVKYVAVCCDVDNVDNYNKLCEETIAYLTNASAIVSAPSHVESAYKDIPLINLLLTSSSSSINCL